MRPVSNNGITVIAPLRNRADPSLRANGRSTEHLPVPRTTPPPHDGRPLVLIRKHSTRAAHAVINTFNSLMAPAGFPRGGERRRESRRLNLPDVLRRQAFCSLVSVRETPCRAAGRYFSLRGGVRPELNGRLKVGTE